ncbi:MAG: helix-turn-helix domain-containing protein [Pseudonocardiaceae bacterium]
MRRTLALAESEQVRAARRALGRQLAAFRAAAGLSQHRFAPLTHYGRSTVANVEVGRQNVTRDFWQRCDELLNADGALVRGYDELDALVSQEREQRRGVPAAQLELGSSAQVNEVLTHLREQWHLLVKTDNLLGPRHALAGVLDQIAIMEALLHSTRDKTRTEVILLAARYAESAAWLHEDIGDMARARYWTGRAMEWAHEAGDPLMLAWTLFRRSQQATAAHDAGQVIGLARAAGRDGDELPAPMRAAILQQEAQGHALDGDELASQLLLDEAHGWAATDDAGDARLGHGSFCTASYLEIQRAKCWQMVGKPRQAALLYEPALIDLPAVYHRDRGIALVGLANAYAATGEPERAATVAVKALCIARSSGSTRMLHEVTAVGQTLSSFQALAPVKVLLDQLVGAV